MSAFAVEMYEGTTDSFSPRCDDVGWNLLGSLGSKCSTPIPEGYRGVENDSLRAWYAQTAAISTKELARIYSLAVVDANSVSAQLTHGFYDAIATPISIFAEPSAKAAEVVSEPRAYVAFKETAARLQMTDEDFGALVGIGRTTPSSWLRDQREPRASTVRKLYELQATLTAVANVLGEDGLMTWLDAGSPTPREVVLEGRWDELNDMIWNALFAPTIKNQPDLSWAPEELKPVTENEQKAPTPKATRRKLN